MFGCWLILSMAGLCMQLSYPENLYQFGLNLALKGDFSKAEQCFSETLRLEPQNAEAWKSRCMTRGMLGNLSGAEADWLAAQSWRAEAVREKLEQALNAKDWNNVLFLTKWHLKKGCLNAIGQYYLAGALLELGRKNEAYLLLSQAIAKEDELASKRGDAHFVFGFLILEMSHLQSDKNQEIRRALHHFELAWQHHHQSAPLLVARASAHNELNDSQETVRNLRRAVIMDSKSIPGRVCLIGSLMVAKRWDDAQDELVWLKRMNMTDGEKTQYSQAVTSLEASVAQKMEVTISIRLQEIFVAAESGAANVRVTIQPKR